MYGAIAAQAIHRPRKLMRRALFVRFVLTRLISRR
jgi:hypothetical protein